MNTIREIILDKILNVFLHVVFVSRDKEYILKTLNQKHKDSTSFNLSIPVPDIIVTKIDETHDKWVLLYADMPIECEVTWMHSQTYNGQYVLLKVE